MLKNIYRNIIAFILLALLLLKVSSFHVYSHQDDATDAIENCKTCELAIENENSAFLVETPFDAIQHNNTFFEKTVTLYSSYELPVSYLHFTTFGRPPPVVV